jgi:two-component system CheB/CheR fusion protein
MPDDAAEPPLQAAPFAKPRIVAIGASAGGLAATRELLVGMPAVTGLAFVLVLHLDPSHPSMLVDLLSRETAMPVVEACDGMTLLPNRLHVIAPGTDLVVVNNMLSVSPSSVRHGIRLPFDKLLMSLANPQQGPVAAVVLSGTGSDGSHGLRALHVHNCLAFAQAPAEASEPGMPQSAIATGCVDLVLPVAGIAAELLTFSRTQPVRMAFGAKPLAPRLATAPDWLGPVITLLQAGAGLNFTSYKPGTLVRRTQRRAAMAGFGSDDLTGYVDLLRRDNAEVRLLADELLINVTGFFRDSWVFDYLAETVIPALVAQHEGEQPLRIWSAACSTGEETYSLAMLLLAEIERNRPGLKLQIFATDIDADAVAVAREGLYTTAVAALVPAALRQRFFTADSLGWRVNAELRSCIVFAVQDLLADPPFSQLDMVCCRNLLIYLDHVAQDKVMALFHFALRPNGLLLLGSAESAGEIGNRFAFVLKKIKLYKRLEPKRASEQKFLVPPRMAFRAKRPPSIVPIDGDPEQFGRSLLISRHAPTALLIDSNFLCLAIIGATGRYLQGAPSLPLHGVLPLLPAAQRSALRRAVARALKTDAQVVTAMQVSHDGGRFVMAVDPTSWEGEAAFLVVFRDVAHAVPPNVALDDAAVVFDAQLDVLRAELDEALHAIERADLEEQTVRADTLSVNEEYQTANEELLTSQEELQSLNEELSALNGQLQETLDRQRTTSDDLQNVLFSTDVATVFLDRALNIRFFTPATRRLFRMLPSDIGRPLSDLAPAAVDATLTSDARAVLADGVPMEREISAADGAWFTRRILPYRTHAQLVEGVVITFVDITERKHAAGILVEARHQADAANLAKSRFLAAASHDLRQPLQTLVLLQELLAQKTHSDESRTLLDRVDRTLAAMSGMLNALLDINQIEAGSVHAEKEIFAIAQLLERVEQEFGIQAESHGQRLKVVPCRALVMSDPRLLSQIIQNLVSNALKYTRRGSVLVGCRRRGRFLDIEVWDNGVGIPAGEIEAVFKAYHQLEPKSSDRSHGLGLGLSIVHRLSGLLDHPVTVESTPGKGSMFRISVLLANVGDLALRDPPTPATEVMTAHTGADILLVDDDAEFLDLVGLLLRGAGHRTALAADEAGALRALQHEMPRPALVISDYNFEGGSNGLQVVATLRARLGQQLPVIMLSGDISVEAMSRIPGEACVRLAKPVRMHELLAVIDDLLFPTRGTPEPVAVEEIVYVVDDDPPTLQALTAMLGENGYTVQGFGSSEALLAAWEPNAAACLLVDATLPGMSGLELIRRLRDEDRLPPSIMLTGRGDVDMAVAAMKIGALDFIEKPATGPAILTSVRKAIATGRGRRADVAERHHAAALISRLTKRQRQVMQLIVDGHPSKNIASDLSLSQRTVEKYRAEVMHKTGMRSLPALARLVLAAARAPLADD